MRADSLLLLALALLAGCGSAPPVQDREIWDGNQGLREEKVRALEETAPVLRVSLDGETFRVEDLILGKSVSVRVPSGDPQGRRVRYQGHFLDFLGAKVGHGAESCDLSTGEKATLLKDGHLRLIP